MKVRFEYVSGTTAVVDIGEGPADNDDWFAWVIKRTDDLVSILERGGELVEQENGLRWLPVSEEVK